MPARRVLLVDDHAGFVTSARALLTYEGMDVVATAANAAEAIEMCFSFRPDVLLLDIHLPDRSGVEVARTLAARGDAPDMILISSDIDAASRPDVQSAPVRGFVPKRDLTCATIEALLD